MKRVALWVVVLLLVVIAGAFALLPGYVDGDMNRVAVKSPSAIPDSVRAFHDSLFVADLHADELLWARDPLDRATRGHVDVPRLVDGGFHSA